MRRRLTGLNQKVSELPDFTPGRQPTDATWADYEVWQEDREAWAVKNLAGGAANLPPYMGWIPDQPWTPYAADGTPNF
ncbi:hypothetical protein [Paenarthrobacter sp. Y-19]|uniref:hypothetical protein n=1 Tax=Paenarthrobacter sp. Y-19 TaxID=3031125 RepID=UPI0023DBF84E|nr:hypothetical protein [Paenarthrobacter sp. Y-19]